MANDDFVSENTTGIIYYHRLLDIKINDYMITYFFVASAALPM